MKILKQVYAPSLKKNVVFGRKRPVAIGPHLRASKYLAANLPAPPATCSYTSAAAQALAQMYGNDSLGDCVIAGGYHIVGVETGNAGKAFIATQKQIITDYSAIGGYVPSDPSTDQGCDEPTALNYWQNHGFANGTKILGWLSVDPSNLTQVQQVLWLFENVMFGVEMPDAWVNPFPSASGFTWGVSGAPDPENGHCFVGAGYNSAGVQIDTWAMMGTVTWAALQKYCAASAYGELYVMITPDQLAKGQTKAPNGFAWADLINDFNTLGGHVPVPPAPTPPAPTPTPPAPTPPVQATRTIVITGATKVTIDGKVV